MNTISTNGGNHQFNELYARQDQLGHNNVVMTGSSMTPEPTAHANPLTGGLHREQSYDNQEMMNGGKLFLTRQVTGQNANAAESRTISDL